MTTTTTETAVRAQTEAFLQHDDDNTPGATVPPGEQHAYPLDRSVEGLYSCLLYTSDAADD